MNKVRRGAVWIVNLGQPSDVIGAEVYKIRPCVVISDDQIGVLSVRLVAPILTHRPCHDRKLWLVVLQPDRSNQLDHVSVADALQVRSV